MKSTYEQFCSEIRVASHLIGTFNLKIKEFEKLIRSTRHIADSKFIEI